MSLKRKTRYLFYLGLACLAAILLAAALYLVGQTSLFERLIFDHDAPALCIKLGAGLVALFLAVIVVAVRQKNVQPDANRKEG